jgi:hypothetical protein
MEYFYHYTNLENWEKIQQEGLTPGKPIGRGSRGSKSKHELASKLATFGFASPAPENWSLYNLNRPSAEDPHSLLAYLLKCIGENKDEIVLLKVHVRPDDDVRVGEYKNIWEKFDSHEAVPEGMNNYCESVIDPRDNFNAAASMLLPEVLCFNTMPANRIELIEKISVKTYEEIRSYIERKQAEPKI